MTLTCKGAQICPRARFWFKNPQDHGTSRSVLSLLTRHWNHGSSQWSIVKFEPSVHHIPRFNVSHTESCDDTIGVKCIQKLFGNVYQHFLCYCHLSTHLYRLAQLCWVLLLFFIPHGCLPSEQIDGNPRGQETLVLLPLEGLTKEGQKAGWRDHAHLTWQSLGDSCSPTLLTTTIWVSLMRFGKEIEKG